MKVRPLWSVFDEICVETQPSVSWFMSLNVSVIEE